MEDNQPIIKKFESNLSRFKVVKNNSGSNRALAIEPFEKRINADRKVSGYPPYPIEKIATMLSHLTEQDLDAFYKKCCEAKNFGAYFHWALKPENKK